MVDEVWESQERLDAFGERLVPVVQEHHVASGQPQIMPVVNVLQ